VSFPQVKSRSKVSLNALKTFEAVARLGSMTSAAQELSVTPGAVSRQIAELQALVSFDLFDGRRHDRQLTKSGRFLARTLTSALDEIDAALTALDESHDWTLDVACLSTMAIRWLIPRLHRFRLQHPNIDLRLSTDPLRPDQPRNRLDVSILALGPGEKVMTQDVPLFEELLGPVQKPGLMGFDATAGLPLLTSKTRPKAWEEWHEQAMDTSTGPVKRVEFEHLSLAIEAAASGLGVCVTPEHLVVQDIAGGRLVAPYGFQRSGYTYIARPHGQQKRHSEAFIEWIRKETTA
jgi:LysR family transcriptional regulator, glycine cleavage system transcriptional activator